MPNGAAALSRLSALHPCWESRCVAAVITVVCMNGFERELRGRILGMAAHATIAGANDNAIKDWRQQASIAEQHPRVIGVAPYVDGQAMVTQGGRVRGVLVRGVQPALEPHVSDVHKHILSGSFEDLKPGQYNVVIGTGLARAIGAKVGAKVTVVAPQARVTPAGVLPRLRRFTVVGLFKVDHGQFDNNLVLMHTRDAAKLFRLPGEVSGIRLKVDDIYAAREVSREVARSLGDRSMFDWTRHHANLFKALKLEKTVMFVILSLIVAVGAFNIISTLIMVVTDKQADIAILRTLGLTPNRVMRIFIVQGFVIGLIGAAIGAVGGIALALNVETLVPAIESLFDTQFMSADIYYITQVPSELRWSDVYTITGISFVLTVLATIYPAQAARRICAGAPL